MTTINLNVEIEALNNPELLDNLMNTIRAFGRAELKITDGSRRGTYTQVTYQNGEFLQYQSGSSNEDIDTIFDLLGLPVQLIEGYREIKVNTNYREHLALPSHRESVDEELSTCRLPVYINTKPAILSAGVRVIGSNTPPPEPADVLIIVGYTSGEVTLDADHDTIRMWMKPSSAVPYTDWVGKQGSVCLTMLSEGIKVTGILLT